MMATVQLLHFPFLIIVFFLSAERASAQVGGCPCGILTKAVSSAHSATRAHFSAKLGQLETSVVSGLMSQTRQLSSGQEKMIAALEALHDAEMETLRQFENEQIARKASFDRATTHSGCLAATGGTKLIAAEETRSEVVKQMVEQIEYWNDGEDRADQSDKAVAASISVQLEARKDTITPFGELLMGNKDLDENDLKNLALQIQILTNPTPEPAPSLDGSAEAAAAYLRIQNEERVRSVVQQYFTDKAARFARTLNAEGWYEAATGKAPIGPISSMNLVRAEGARRFTSLAWHGEQSQANAVILAREANRMSAFDIYLRSMEFEQRERTNDILATLLSLNLNK